MVTSPVTVCKPEVYESKRIQLSSPILHIGSESRLNPFEYVQTSSKVHLPNQEALARALHQRGRLKDYIRAIENRQDITQLLEDTFGPNWWNQQDPNGELIFPKIAISRKWTNQQITDLRPMIRNGMGQLYIPGSSIKGAIRTAIAYHLLKHEDRYQVPKHQQISEIEQRLRQKLKQGDVGHGQRKKFLDDQLFMDDLFTNFSLGYQGREVTSRSASRIGPNTDFMRAIKVTDAEPLIENRVVNKRGKEVITNLPAVAEVIVSSRFPNYSAKYRASIYAEMVRNAQTEFTLSLDSEMLSWFLHKEGMKIPFKNLTELLQICQEFAQDQWDYEHDYWESIKTNPNAQGKNLDFGEIRTFYAPTACPFSLRLGWASGMTGTTVNLLFDDQLKADIRDAAGIPAPNFEAPKSRRTVVASSGEIKHVLGWVKFKPC